MPGHNASKHHASFLSSDYQRERPEAEVLYVEVLEGRKRTLGPTRKNTLDSQFVEQWGCSSSFFIDAAYCYL